LKISLKESTNINLCKSRKLYLHAGGGKTGSSALQNFLHNNKNNLDNLGFSYKTNLKEEWIDYKITAGNGTMLCNMLKKGNSAEITIIIDRLFGNHLNAICSSEAFETLNRSEWKLLIDTCKKSNIIVKIIFYVRNIDNYLRSAYDQYLKRHSLSLSFNQFVKRVKWLHYKTLKNIHSLSSDNVEHSVQSYDLNKSTLILNFLYQLDIAKKYFDLFYITDVTVNRSLTQRERNLLRNVNIIYSNDYVCTKLSDMLIYTNPELTSEKIDIDKNIKQDIQGIFKDQVDWINKFFFEGKNIVQLISSNYSLKNKGTIKAISNNQTNDIMDKLEKELYRRNNIENLLLPSGFDPLYYLIMNKDLLIADIDPVEHYIQYGIKEKRRYKNGTQ